MIKIAICDDEVRAVQDLYNKMKLFLNTKSSPYTISRFFSGESLLAEISLKGAYFDAIFLDIKMNQASGIETAKEIRKVNDKTIIIFVTVHKEFVFEAFEVEASNYLLKPIEITKLNKTLEKIVLSVSQKTDHFLTLQKNSEIVKIPFSDILYCEVKNHRLFIYTPDHTYEYISKIDAMEKDLTGDFFRCHRSYIVNLRFITRYSDGFAYSKHNEKIPVATRRQQLFMKALLHYQRKEI